MKTKITKMIRSKIRIKSRKDSSKNPTPNLDLALSPLPNHSLTLNPTLILFAYP